MHAPNVADCDSWLLVCTRKQNALSAYEDLLFMYLSAAFGPTDCQRLTLQELLNRGRTDNLVTWADPEAPRQFR